MIISTNRDPILPIFQSLMRRTTTCLNDEARRLGPRYYANRNGVDLEKDVCRALNVCAEGTPFEGTIEHVSGSAFPDIVAMKYYGVEVKSTKEDKWKSIGSSILESTRQDGIKRIYLTFGKLKDPVEFRSRPYEECLSGISVTHYPRYQIDMNLMPGETIFDRMKISYDDLRKREDPVTPVAEYYQKRMKPGERLWWVKSEDVSIGSPVVIRQWSNLDYHEKGDLITKGLARFPEICASNYDNYANWLITDHSVMNHHIRDEFSGGGVYVRYNDNGEKQLFPKIFLNIEKYGTMLIDELTSLDCDVLFDYWKEEADSCDGDRVDVWCQIAARMIKRGRNNREAVEKMSTDQVYEFIVSLLRKAR